MINDKENDKVESANSTGDFYANFRQEPVDIDILFGYRFFVLYYVLRCATLKTDLRKEYLSISVPFHVNHCDSQFETKREGF